MRLFPVALLLSLVLAAPAAALPAGENVAVSQLPDAGDADIAYNPDTDQFVVVYVGETGFGSQGIYARLLDGDGDPVGNPRKFGDGANLRDPSVAWVPQYGIYAIAWAAEGAPGHGHSIIMRKVKANLLTGYASQVISEEPGGSNPGSASHPDISVPFARNLWVLWSHDPLGDGDLEIYRSIFGPSVSGDELVTMDPISQAGAARDAVAPAIAWSHGDNAMFLMVWAQDGEIWGQVQSELHGGNGIRRDDFKISTTAGAANPAVAYNDATHEWLVAYTAGGHVRAKRIRSATQGILAGELDVSALSGAPATHPAVAYNPDGAEWMVTWSGTDPALAAGETEIFSQRISSAGALLGGDDVRVSGMGGTGDPRFHADDPAVAYGTTAGSFISAWEGDDQTDDVFHVFAGSTFGADEPAPRPPQQNVPGTVLNPGGGSGGGAPPSGQGLPSGGGTNRSSAGMPGGSTIDLGGGGKSFRVPVRCNGPDACSGALRADTVKAFAAARRKRVALGRARFTVRAGATRKVAVRLTKKGRRLLARKRRLAVRLTLTMSGRKAVRRTVKLRARRR
jgi:hypothetical protein